MCRVRRLSFSMHDLHHPWAGNTNMINGFYEEPSQEGRGEYRYLDHRHTPDTLPGCSGDSKGIIQRYD